MKKLSLAGILIILVLSATWGEIQDQTAQDIFQKALSLERAVGDLNEAIALYEKVVEKSTDEALAAKAQLRIGICYEKLGSQEAQKAYRRLIDQYPGQKEEVALARARLAKLEEAEAGRIPERAGLIFRKLDFPGSGATPQVRLSPDGKKILYIGIQDDEPRYSIRLLDFATGQGKILVDGIDGNVWTHIFSWSPDGKRIVYRPRGGELRMINSEGGTSVPFWADPDKKTTVLPLDWSGQNHSILVSILEDSEHKVSLTMLPDNGGEPRTVVSGDSRELEYWAQFSPDGRYVVGRKTKNNNNDVYVWAADGSSEVNVTSHPANDSYPYWSPDGKYIVFVSDRNRTVDLWAVPMSGSQPAGDPFRIQADIGKTKVPSDFTKGGHLVFDVTGSLANPPDLFVLPVDPKTGEALGPFHPFGKYPMDGLAVYRWSPDGSRIAYTSRKGNFQLPNAYISSGREDDDLEIPANEYFMGCVEWSRDGKSLLFPGFLRGEERPGIFRISLQDLTVAPVYAPGERLGPDWSGNYGGLRWLPLAGKYMFFRWLSDAEEEIYLMDPLDDKILRVGSKPVPKDYEAPSPDGRYVADIEAKTGNFVLLSLADGVSRVVSQLPPSSEIGISFSWSPDGTKIAWIEDRRLQVMTVPDGTPQTLYEAPQGRKIGGGLASTPNTSWSPDGGRIAFFLKDVVPDSQSLPEIWIVGATGDSPRKIADAPHSHQVMLEVIWHPSGKMIFAQGLDARFLKEHNEFWVMENFLPPANAAEKLKK